MPGGRGPARPTRTRLPRPAPAGGSTAAHQEERYDKNSEPDAAPPPHDGVRSVHSVRTLVGPVLSRPHGVDDLSCSCVVSVCREDRRCSGRERSRRKRHDAPAVRSVGPRSAFRLPPALRIMRFPWWGARARVTGATPAAQRQGPLALGVAVSPHPSCQEALPSFLCPVRPPAHAVQGSGGSGAAAQAEGEQPVRRSPARWTDEPPPGCRRCSPSPRSRWAPAGRSTTCWSSHCR